MANDERRIVLMSCCAPCSAAAVRSAGLPVLFYNPNIYPREEYDRRLAEQKKLCDKYGVLLFAGPYEHEKWLAEVRGLESLPERGHRCEKCFAMRARFGADWARRNGFEAVASVFGVSPHKDKSQVDRAFASTGIYDGTDFGFAPEPGGYRQKYCGCEFSETYNEN